MDLASTFIAFVLSLNKDQHVRFYFLPFILHCTSDHERRRLLWAFFFVSFLVFLLLFFLITLGRFLGLNRTFAAFGSQRQEGDLGSIRGSLDNSA